MLRLFIPYIYVQNFLHFNSSFSPLALTPLHTHTHTHTPLHIVLRVIPYQIYTDQKRCHLPSIFGRYLFSSNIIVSSNLNPYELARTTPTHSPSCYPISNIHRPKTMSFTFNLWTISI